MANNNENKVLKSSIEREQNELACSAEREKIKDSKNLNVPHKREQSELVCSAEREEQVTKSTASGNVPHLRFPEFCGEWKKCTINDLATVVGGGTPDTTVKSYWGGDIQWFTPSEIGKNKYVDFSLRTITRDGLDNSSAKLLPLHTILLSSRATVGECSIASNECTTNQGFQSLIAKQCNIDFLYYLIQTKKKDLIRNACGSTFLEISANEIRKIKVAVPVQNEQEQIAKLLSLVDERIATQNKIIEDLKKLRSAIVEKLYNQSYYTHRLEDIIEQISERNRKNLIDNVLSVSNKQGFINQSEQFEDRIVASDDTSNYKVVKKDDFAYNPARINVGSIARLTSFEIGIVSPMYICFRVKDGIIPQFIEHFFTTSYFFNEMQKRLEGSVRLCLSFEGMCNIPIFIPRLEEQKNIGKKIEILSEKIDIETRLLLCLKNQKQYFLSQMFI